MNLSRSGLSRCAALLLLTLLCEAGHADGAPFDLTGPVLEVTVTRSGTTLPIAEVPNLAAGDRIWIRANLPASQSAHYLLVSAFLSGSTNPPPQSWFVACKAWTAKCRLDGLTVTVPADAQQMVVFLAPEAGGDFKTLMGAVRGRPGAFVRTSQDLDQAALDRSRLERYLSTIRALNDAAPAKIAQVAPLLARSLAIKVDPKCLDRIPELQAPCLMEGQESLILNDGHSTSIVEALTSGPGGDLAMQASYSPQLGYGYYSPYIASIFDIAKILDSFHTAQYQYIPALASLKGNTVDLTLNTAPSFHDPKSVLVAALPAVEPAQLPPLHAVDPKEIYCARRTTLVLPVEGAPLVFSTDYAHDMTLRLTGSSGKSLDLPAVADASQGGFVIDTAGLSGAALGDSVQATLLGYWGFDPYRGPTFELRNARAVAWQLASADEAALIVGRQETVHLRAESVSCVDSIMLKDPGGKELKAEWKKLKPDEVEVKLPLQDATPGPMTLLVAQYGAAQPEPIGVHGFAEAGRFDGFEIHAGDAQGVLKGSRLDEVASLAIKNIVFTPGELLSRQGNDELPMLATDTAAAADLRPERTLSARVTLKDGRVRTVSATVDAPRPKVVLINKSVQLSALGSESNIQLADAGELPLDATMIFSVHAESAAGFARDETLDVATADESIIVSLSVANGGLALENSRVAVATLNPLKAFGASSYGPLKYRVNAKGVAGDWQPLATLVRLPTLKSLECPPTADVACKLSGSNLYLIDSLSADASFKKPVVVPDGFLGTSLPVPHPSAGTLYLKLRDDPQIVNPTSLTAQQLPATPAEIDRSEARESALNNQGSVSAPAASPQAPSPQAPSSQAPSAAAPAAPGALGAGAGAPAGTAPARAAPAGAAPSPGAPAATPGAQPPAPGIAAPAASAAVPHAAGAGAPGAAPPAGADPAIGSAGAATGAPAQAPHAATVAGQSSGP